jgi:hypothetical protein
MADYRREKWIEPYQKALVELEHAQMRGRIGDARTEILARIEILKDIPGLHAEERQAIDDALGALQFLLLEEDRYDENQRRETLANAQRKLRILAPRIASLKEG